MIDFALPADVFWMSTARRSASRGGLRHQRFDSLADAICHVMGDETERYSLSIDTDEASYDRDAVEAIYASDAFGKYRGETAGVAGKA